MFFDSNYLLYVLLPTIAITLLAQWYVRSSFGKWHKVRNSAGLSGAAIAERIIRRTPVGDVRYERATMRSAGAAGVRVERGAGAFGDHYDPAQPQRAALPGDVGARLGGGDGGCRTRAGACLAT